MRVTQILRAIVTWRPSCQHSAQFPADQKKLFTACLEAVAQCGFSLVEHDRDAGSITAETSFGEIIQIIVDENSVVHARSQSDPSPVTLLSREVSWWAKNRDNIDKLFYAIEKTLGRGPYPRSAAAHESAPTAWSKPSAR